MSVAEAVRECIHCRRFTTLCCSDCAIDRGLLVPVCPLCWLTHEITVKHAVPSLLHPPRDPS